MCVPAPPEVAGAGLSQSLESAFDTLVIAMCHIQEYLGVRA